MVHILFVRSEPLLPLLPLSRLRELQQPGLVWVLTMELPILVLPNTRLMVFAEPGIRHMPMRQLHTVLIQFVLPVQLLPLLLLGQLKALPLPGLATESLAEPMLPVLLIIL
jgi:uncharacterized membrane protein YfbV (UPF0208 family)